MKCASRHQDAYPEIFVIRDQYLSIATNSNGHDAPEPGDACRAIHESVRQTAGNGLDAAVSIEDADRFIAPIREPEAALAVQVKPVRLVKECCIFRPIPVAPNTLQGSGASGRRCPRSNRTGRRAHSPSCACCPARHAVTARLAR